MREVTVRAMVTDPWDSAVPQLLVTWYDERGRTYGARLPLTEGIPEPLAPTPPPPPPDPIKARFPALTDADVAWVREQQAVANSTFSAPVHAQVSRNVTASKGDS